MGIKNALTECKYISDQPHDGQTEVKQIAGALTTLGEFCKDGYRPQPIKGALTKGMNGNKRGPKKY